MLDRVVLPPQSFSVQFLRMSVEGVLKSLKIIRLKYGEDNIDRLHYFLTANFLVAASTIATVKMFEGRAIECTSPTDFPKSWITVSRSFLSPSERRSLKGWIVKVLSN